MDSGHLRVFRSTWKQDIGIGSFGSCRVEDRTFVPPVVPSHPISFWMNCDLVILQFKVWPLHCNELLYTIKTRGRLIISISVACLSFLQRVFAQKPSIYYHLPLRRKAKLVKVEQQTKRSPKQILSLLAFTYISNDISLIHIKRWFSVDSFSLTLRGLAVMRGILASVSASGLLTFFCLSLFWVWVSRLKYNDGGMLNTFETMIALSLLVMDLIQFAVKAVQLIMHLS